MPEVRERKSNDKIKEKDGGKNSPVKKDVRRQMTAKYVKELTQRQRNRDTGGNTAPEVQAAEQVEEKIYTTADSLREHTADAVSIATIKNSNNNPSEQTSDVHRPEEPERVLVE